MAGGLESGRRRASRIRTDFYKSPDRIQRLRFRSLVVVVLVLAVYLGSSLSPGSSQRYSHGPLCRAHAALETRCHECHTDFQAIQPQAWGAAWEGVQVANAAKCSVCHPEATTHHADMTKLEVSADMGCSSCHRDHRGVEADLTRVSDHVCLDCHRDLAAIRLTNAPELSEDRSQVTAFAPGQHPQFASLVADTGNVKFNHHLHMTAGLTKTGTTRGAMTLEDLPDDDWRDAYRVAGQEDSAAIQLTCASCHQRDDTAGRLAGKIRPGSDGEFMLPITYDAHCQACHPLQYRAGQDIADVPHGISIPAVQAAVASNIARTFLMEQAADETTPRPPQPIPGPRWGWNPTGEERDARFPSEVEKALLPLLQTEQGCQKCHDLNEQQTDFSDNVTPRIPASWFQHSGFHHRSHQIVDCQHCHPQAYPGNSQQQPDQDTVMIRGLDSCVECHTDVVSAEVPFSGTRSECMTCHRYHTDRRLPQRPATDLSSLHALRHGELSLKQPGVGSVPQVQHGVGPHHESPFAEHDNVETRSHVH